MQKFRKIFAGLTICAMIALMVPAAKAAASDGDLIKIDGNSAVFFLKGGKFYTFPNEATYFSWYSDFNAVKVVSQAEMNTYMPGGNVVMRPGTKLVKITINPTVYAVEPNGVLRAIASEADAIALYGNLWAQKVVDVPTGFFTNYTVGTPLASNMFPVGSLLNAKGTTDVYYWDGTSYRKFANDAALVANGFSFDYVVSTDKTLTPVGTPIAGAEAALFNVPQSATTGQAGGVVTAPSGSGLTVAIASDTSAAMNLPQNANNVPFLKFNLTAANDGDMTITSLAVTRKGIGAAADFANIYLYDGMTRLTTGRSVNSSTNKGTFTGLNLVIPKGTTRTITLTADLSGTNAGGHNDAFSIDMASDVVTTGGVVSGNFPMMGNMMSIVAQNVGSVTIAKTQSIANPKAGEMGAKIAAFTLTAGSSEDITVKNITLYQIGNIANSNIKNFVLKQGGNTVATAAMVSGNNINLVFTTPYAMLKGDVKTFELYADVNGAARAGDTIRVYLDNNSDLYATGNTYGFGVGVVRGAYDNGAGDGTDASWVSIDAGQVTMAFQGPAVTDYAVQTKGAELFRFTITSQSNVEIRNTRLNLTAPTSTTGGLVNGTANTSNYTNIKFVDATTGAVVAGPMDDSSTGSDSSQDLIYTDTWNVNAGQTRTIKVLADIANFTPGASETIKASLSAFQSNDIKNLDNNLFVDTSTIVPSSGMTGNTHNVKAGSLTVSQAGTPSVNTYINGAQNVAMTGINLQAGTGKDLTITSVKVTAAGTNSCSTVGNCILDLKLMDGTTQVGQTKSLSSGTATFSSLMVPVAKGTTKTLVVVADLNNVSSFSNSTITVSVATVSSDITGQDADGNTISASGTVSGIAQNITTAGSVSVVRAGDQPGVSDARLVAAGANDVTIGKFNFSAVNEDLKLNKIRIKVRGTANGDGAIREISQISLWDDASNTMVAAYSTPSALTDSGSVTWAVADFNSTSADFIVPKSGSKTLTVKANFNSTSNGARIGQTLTAEIDSSTSLFTTGALYEFRGVNGSNTVYNTLASDVPANAMYVYKSVPTIAAVALPTNTLVGGEQTIARFSVTADAKGAIDWTRLNFTVNGSAFTGSGAVTGARIVDESGTTLANTVTTITGLTASATPTGTVLVTSSVDQQIAAGSTRTYSLKATIAGAQVGSSLSTYVAAPSVYAIPNTQANVATTTPSFLWSDESGWDGTTYVAHAFGSSKDYINEYRVKTLPSDSQTLAK